MARAIAAGKTATAAATKAAGITGPLKIEYRSVGSLTPYKGNARTHSEAQIRQIANSIRDFGFNDPIAIDAAGEIITGHGTLAAARTLGMAEVPVTVLGHLTDAQKRAYILAHNRIALNAGWDADLLKVELAEITAQGIDAAALGFNDAEIAKALGLRAGATDENELPESPEKAVTLPGDVWRLGEHTLVCGDCTDSMTVTACLGAIKPHLMVTDPPYGIEYDADWRTTKRNADGSLLSTGEGRATGVVQNDDRADWAAAWVLFPGDVAYVWHSSLKSPDVARSLEACDFQRRAEIVWRKTNIVVGRGDYHWQHESCWYAVRKGRVGHWAGDRKQSTVWDIPIIDNDTGHSTQKPVECMRRPIENNSNPGQAIYEPFSGSGSTIIACEQTGRICHAIEIVPAYCDIAILRWQNFTRKNAVLLSTGQTFTEVLGDRVPDKVIRGAKPKRKKKGGA